MVHTKILYELVRLVRKKNGARKNLTGLYYLPNSILRPIILTAARNINVSPIESNWNSFFLLVPKFDDKKETFHS